MDANGWRPVASSDALIRVFVKEVRGDNVIIFLFGTDGIMQYPITVSADALLPPSPAHEVK